MLYFTFHLIKSAVLIIQSELSKMFLRSQILLVGDDLKKGGGGGGDFIAWLFAKM